MQNNTTHETTHCTLKLYKLPAPKIKYRHSCAEKVYYRTLEALYVSNSDFLFATVLTCLQFHTTESFVAMASKNQTNHKWSCKFVDCYTWNNSGHLLMSLTLLVEGRQCPQNCHISDPQEPPSWNGSWSG